MRAGHYNRMMSDAGTARPSARRNTASPLSVVDQVASSILTLILSNELAPGDPIAIKQLSNRLGVSHVPIREALRRLEGRGLVVFRRGRRPTIAPIGVEDLDSLFILRELVEGGVARRSSDSAVSARKAELDSALTDLRVALEQGDAVDVYGAHSRLHFALLPDATDWDRRVLDQLWTAAERYIQLYMGFQPAPEAVETIVGLHEQLIKDAVEPGNLAAAIVDHIRTSHAFLLSVMPDTRPL